MALDPATAKLIAKVVISQITDEEKRQRLIIGIIIGIVVFTFIIMIPLFALTSTIDKIKRGCPSGQPLFVYCDLGD